MTMRTATIPTEIKAASKREQSQARLSSAERELARAMLKVLMNHIYELQKGVRQMVLFTCDKRYGDQTIERLESQGIPYVLQPAGQKNLNVYFGRRECLEAIRLIVTRPLNQLTPEEDFILGTMLGYDLCAQCERYCKRKNGCKGDCDGKCIKKN
ncbi:Protein of unknown function [Prevotella communis]|uniref:DUF2023 domain-containing protein n=2 Tax=Prevotella communis TaxID=2913614 RepID=A0A1G7W344_9BACT|nr:Protein of unknown function [Prevotella communis]